MQNTQQCRSFFNVTGTVVCFYLIKREVDAFESSLDGESRWMLEVDEELDVKSVCLFQSPPNI